MSPSLATVFGLISAERGRQEVKHGPNTHPHLDPIIDGQESMLALAKELRAIRHAEELGVPTVDYAKFLCESARSNKALNWAVILVEELAEAIEQAAFHDEEELENELIQVAAVAVAWIQDIHAKRMKRGFNAAVR